ncbi:MAG: YcxB family protein [Erysipelotrichales bacterium]|nr:YcxB family protein [Erysipelotrichales bacterium]
MSFKFETAYNQEAVTIMAKALRKTIRKKHSTRSHILGVIVAVIAILLTLPIGDKEFTLNFKTIITWLAALVIVGALVFEDRLNGYIARKRMLPGLAKSSVTFSEDSYYSETALGNSEFKYTNIIMLVESSDYFIFIFSPNHAQIYNKNSITGGTMEEFREFIKGVTKLEIHNI